MEAMNGVTNTAENSLIGYDSISKSSSGEATIESAVVSIADEYVSSVEDDLEIYTIYSAVPKTTYSKNLYYYDLLGKNTEVNRIINNINEYIWSYTRGDLDSEDIECIIKQSYSDMLSYCVANGMTSGEDTEYNTKVLKETFDFFISRATVVTNHANQNEGHAYASEMGYTPRLTAYYNSKYYYDWENLKQACISTAEELAQENGLNFDAEKTYENMLYNKDYNQIWQYRNSEVCKVIDLSFVPPEDFIMFYTSDQYSIEDRKNASLYYLSAENPAFGKTSGFSGCDYAIFVPRGASLLQSTAFKALQNLISKGSTRFDITSYLSFGGSCLSDEKFEAAFTSLVQNLINNFYNGKITVIRNGTKTDYNVPFDDFGAPKSYNGSELISDYEYEGFFNNFIFNRL